MGREARTMKVVAKAVSRPDSDTSLTAITKNKPGRRKSISRIKNKKKRRRRELKIY